MKLQLWVYILLQLIILSVGYLLQKRYSKPKKPIIINQQQPIKNSAARIAELMEVFSEVGNKVSFNSDNSLYKYYGQKNWDAATDSLTGIQAEGQFTIVDGIINLQRSNIQGRYIIELRKYYPGHKTVDNKSPVFVKSNITGANPRSLGVAFECRSLKGMHRFSIIVKPQDKHDHLTNSDWITDSLVWVEHKLTMQVPANENFYFEIQVWNESNQPGIIQFKNILIEDLDVNL